MSLTCNYSVSVVPDYITRSLSATKIHRHRQGSAGPILEMLITSQCVFCKHNLPGESIFGRVVNNASVADECGIPYPHLYFREPERILDPICAVTASSEHIERLPMKGEPDLNCMRTP